MVWCSKRIRVKAIKFLLMFLNGHKRRIRLLVSLLLVMVGSYFNPLPQNKIFIMLLIHGCFSLFWLLMIWHIHGNAKFGWNCSFYINLVVVTLLLCRVAYLCKSSRGFFPVFCWIKSSYRCWLPPLNHHGLWGALAYPQKLWNCLHRNTIGSDILIKKLWSSRRSRDYLKERNCLYSLYRPIPFP